MCMYFRQRDTQLVIMIICQTDIVWNKPCCCCSVVQLCPTLRDPMDQSTPGTPTLHCLSQFGQTHVSSFENTVQPSRPLSSPSPCALYLSQHQGKWIRMDRFDLLAVHGTLKSLLQHHNSKASILWRSAFFMVQLPLPYITTGKTIALSIRTFVSKVMSLLFKMLSRFVIAFLPRSRRLLIS